MKSRKLEIKRRKQRSTPGRRLLSEIRPYSIFSLSFNLMPVARLKDADGNPIDLGDDEAVEEWYRNRNTGELEAKVRSICSSRYFKFMNSEQTVHSISKCGYTLFGYPWVYKNVPTIATFEHDIKILKRIAEKYPGLIRKTIEVLTEKYTELYHLSDDYLDWHSWMPVKKIRHLDMLFNPDVSLSRSDLQAKAIQYAETVLLAIPPDKNLRNGQPRLFGMRWFIKHVAFQWRCCSGISTFEHATKNDVALFYAFTIQLINAMYKVVPPKYQDQVLRVVKIDDESIKNVARNVLFEKDTKKCWRGAPNKTVFFMGSGYGEVVWHMGSGSGEVVWYRSKIFSSRLKTIIFLKCERIFFQRGYLKAHIDRKIRNWKKYRHFK